MNTDELRKVTVEDLCHMPDGINVFVKCTSGAVIDSSWLDGWYIKKSNLLQNKDGGFVYMNDVNFDFYVKFKYSLPVAQQLIFDVATELHTGFEGLSKEVLAEKLYDIVSQIDAMDLWKRF